MKCTKCTDGNMSLGILPYVKCNECNGTGLVVFENFDGLCRNWGKTGLLIDVESNKHAELSLCFENIYKDIIKSWTQRSHAKNDKAFQNALFITQKKLHPITIRYQYSPKDDIHTVAGGNGKIIEFSEEYLKAAVIFNNDEELSSIMQIGILRS